MFEDIISYQKKDLDLMKIQVQEENAHAMGLYDYLIERGGSVELEAIANAPAEAEEVTV